MRLECNTDYAEDLREQLRGIHERAQHALDVNTRRQKRNYDRSKRGSVYRQGQFVWLYDNWSKKLGLPWQGPYQVVSVLSDVVFRIQRSARGKTKVVRADRLKLYDGPALVSWVYRTPEGGGREGSRVTQGWQRRSQCR